MQWPTSPLSEPLRGCGLKIVHMRCRAPSGVRTGGRISQWRTHGTKAGLCIAYSGHLISTSLKQRCQGISSLTLSLEYGEPSIASSLQRHQPFQPSLPSPIGSIIENVCYITIEAAKAPIVRGRLTQAFLAAWRRGRNSGSGWDIVSSGP